MARLRETALTVATEAAELVRRMRPGAVGSVDTKSTDTDVVTEADRASERLIRARLAELAPGTAVLGEEGGGTVAAGPEAVTWVVDPIDGTVNYLYGLPYYAVSVAAQVGGHSIAGAVVEPSSGRRWSAALGQGATLDGEPLAVSAVRRLDLTLLGTGFAYAVDRRRRQGAMAAALLGSVRDIRRGGSAALDLCAVAAGWLDGFLEHGLGRWDWAAGALIAAEAGAVVRLPTDHGGIDGELDDGLGADAVLVCAPGVAAELVDAVRAAGAGLV